MTAEIIDFATGKTKNIAETVKCSFCKRTLGTDEKCLDSGNGHIICGRCVVKCNEIIGE